MSREIILHVGSPKCGSTYLQRVMLANRDVLSAHGIHYPAPPGNHPGNGTMIFDSNASSLGRLFGKYDKLVLSHEDLFAMGPRFKGFGELCAAEGIGLQVLVFLRPFSEFIYGDYSQYMKQNIDRYIDAKSAYDGLSFEEFAVHRRTQIAPLGWLKAWQRTTEKPLSLARHREIRPTLEAVLGALPLKWEIDAASANPSLRVSDCEEISEAIAAGVPAGKVRDLYKLAYAKPKLHDRGRTPERSKWLEALFKSQNQEILETFDFDNRLAA